MNKRMQSQISVTKSVTDEDMALINQYTRREFTADEVYVFGLVLCDNEIDRDVQAFSRESLDKLAVLYRGKPGIFDHNARGESQTARVFKTWVSDEPGRLTRYGEGYAALCAKAYMVRCGRTDDLILEVDGGIKKEVSVGCNMTRVMCSVCGADWKKGRCEHLPGKQYGNTPCFGVLDSPDDAYEWSFVAVPAQPAAGVVKQYRYEGGIHVNQSIEQIVKGLGPERESELKAYLGALEEEAQAGRAYLKSLRQEVLSLSCLGGAQIEGEILQSIMDKLNAPQLEALRKAFDARAGALGTVQLAPPPETGNGGNSAFKI